MEFVKFTRNLLTLYIFAGERESNSSKDNVNPILSEAFFKEFVSPILLKVFHVRDVQIRTVLLR